MGRLSLVWVVLVVVLMVLVVVLVVLGVVLGLLEAVAEPLLLPVLKKPPPGAPKPPPGPPKPTKQNKTKNKTKTTQKHCLARTLLYSPFKGLYRTLFERRSLFWACMTWPVLGWFGVALASLRWTGLG